MLQQAPDFISDCAVTLHQGERRQKNFVEKRQYARPNWKLQIKTNMLNSELWERYEIITQIQLNYIRITNTMRIASYANLDSFT